MQALKDNYDIWSMDVLTEREKAEIASQQEANRIRAIQEKHLNDQAKGSDNSLEIEELNEEDEAAFL